MVDTELLQKAIDRDGLPPFYTDYKPATIDPEALFESCYCVEMEENFYDSEPEIPTSLLDSWDFDDPKCKEMWRRMCEDYEPQRLAFNNWQELYVEGNWDLTQEKVDSIAHETLKDYCKKDGRVFAARYDNDTYIYIYARDLKEKCDYRIVLRPRNELDGLYN